MPMTDLMPRRRQSVWERDPGSTSKQDVDHLNAAEAERGQEAPAEGDWPEGQREEHRGHDEGHVHEGE